MSDLAVSDGAPDAPLLEVKDLKVHLRVADRLVRAVDGVDFKVDTAECVGVVGESGSGKSTLIRAISRLMPNLQVDELSGELRFEGRDILRMADRELRTLRRSRGFAMIFQDPLGYLNPTQRVGRQIAEALSPDGRGRSEHRRVLDLLDEVGFADPGAIARRYPHELSGGMRQRVMIAIALASDPKLLFADEPTTALDATVQLQVLETLYRLHKERNMAVAIITHDLGVVAELCDRVYVMQAGKFVENATAVDLFERPQHPYSARLVELSAHRLDFRGMQQ
ncbi:ABC transporter ATP-binding protein [Mesorhizobium sp. ZC-5]|uniref:ABC transporter ATP-binding protein n=1 Tax=Mesorhizobium sp. ZC-5 TaxID=2986066 RepID=UPI0021E7CEBE|nr:ABC transporter ATP-binding protein [Mesorhizobium sp. ZC-5]MCV3238482.1 ABC transporter ATP-binding protein [Mesorhizobium sp. ZC-5]